MGLDEVHTEANRASLRAINGTLASQQDVIRVVLYIQGVANLSNPFNDRLDQFFFDENLTKDHCSSRFANFHTF